MRLREHLEESINSQRGLIQRAVAMGRGRPPFWRSFDANRKWADEAGAAARASDEARYPEREPVCDRGWRE